MYNGANGKCPHESLASTSSSEAGIGSQIGANKGLVTESERRQPTESDSKERQSQEASYSTKVDEQWGFPMDASPLTIKLEYLSAWITSENYGEH